MPATHHPTTPSQQATSWPADETDEPATNPTSRGGLVPVPQRGATNLALLAYGTCATVIATLALLELWPAVAVATALLAIHLVATAPKERP